MKLNYLLCTLHHDLIELGHFFEAIAFKLLSNSAKDPVLKIVLLNTFLKYKAS